MKKRFKKVLLFLMTTVSMMTLMIGTAFAGQEGVANDLSPVKDALTSAFTVGEIASVIGIIIASGVSFVLLWWGARKLVSAIIGVFKTGKLKF